MTPEELIANPQPGLTKLDGGNFTGRTDTLRAFTGLPLSCPHTAINVEPKDGSVYVGPELSNTFSGLSTTTNEELLLHDPEYLKHPIWSLMDGADLIGPLLRTHPFALSGGQQALVSIICALLVARTRVGFDAALEQLDDRTRNFLLPKLSEIGTFDISIAVADNRLAAALDWPDYHVSPIRACEFFGRSPYSSMRINAEAIYGCGSADPVDVYINDVAFRYGDLGFHLENISFDLRGGETYAFMGDNGAGKSTLSKLLAGVLKPSCGAVYVKGKQLTLWRKPGTVFGYHFQDPDVQLFANSVHHELSMSAQQLTSHPRVHSLIDAFCLTDVCDEHPLELPFTLRKRIALAATIALPTPWLILDEPTLGQDDAILEDMVQLVRALNKMGRGVILISHSADFLKKTRALPLVLKNSTIQI